MSSSVRLTLFVILVVVALGVGAVWFLGATPADRRVGEVGGDADLRSTELDHERLDLDRAELGAMRDALGSEEAVPELPLPDPGTLRFRVLDSLSAQPLSGVQVRLLHDRRFATADGVDAELELRLTAGTWEAAIACAGYETLHRRFDVPEQGTADYGTVVLDRGSSRVGIQVQVRQAFASPWTFVDLHGAGRNPCPRCHEEEEEVTEEEIAAADDAATPAEAPLADATEDGELARPLAPTPTPRPDELEGFCRHCGHGESFSRLGRRGNGPMVFGRLASGPYRLRLWSEHAPHGRSHPIEVEPHSEHWHEWLLPTPVQVDFELIDDEGRPFAGPRDEQGELVPASFHYSFFHEGELIASAHVAPLQPSPQQIVLSYRIHQDLSEVLRVESTRSFQNYDWKLLQTQAVLDLQVAAGAVDRPEPRDDRERAEGDSLAFSVDPPAAPEARTLRAERLAPHRHRLFGLPPLEVEVEVRCGRYRSDRLLVHLEQRAGGTVRLRLLPRDENTIQAVDIATFTLSDFADSQLVPKGSYEIRLSSELMDQLELSVPPPPEALDPADSEERP